MTYSDACVQLVRNSEGLRLEAYQDCGGVWTIGYGHTGPDVHAGLVISAMTADSLLHADLQATASRVSEMLAVPVTQGQFDALVDFAFNLGCGRLHGSTLLEMVNRRDFAGAAGQFGLWVHDGAEVLPGLVARRKAEMEMFEGVSVG